ncbi:tetratricopeptide repeat protein [Ectothiorhodospira mobilis]|uniref:O-linked N-acetylglucosamine transferase, SPINDLY family protein n=1 Tax=Ectothiorhodospira mobilis TaxID=195064 RepID=UPI001EE97BCA|nr:tetratricopeptide repeat protein [Ectothiorhodospira mobilis]MCG5536376.1 tetratricopeptide repeat protein [Ectothiorhodospira mobilis]
MKSLERFKKTLTEIQQALEQGQLERAESHCRQGLKRHPRHPLILSSLARVKVAQDQPEEARKCSDRALENGGLKYPSVVHHHLELLEKEKDFEGMLDVARRSLPVSREPIKSKRILARTLIKANRRREALALFEEILKEAPEAGALNDCCNCLYDLGQHEAGFVQNKLAATLEPDALWIRSNLILLGHYLPGMTKEDFIGLHKDWFDTCARLHGKIRQLERRPLEGRKLRIGFISNGFWSHPAGWLSYGAIAMLAHYFPCEIHLYSTHPPKPKDGVAQRFGELPVTHTALHGWSFNAKLQKLLEDELDILVEMSGHSEHSALPLVAARVAPVQVKWIGGLSDTSAAPNMDYLLTDWIETPAGSEDTYTENLIRLPGGYVSYAPPAYMPEVNPLPARENGYITFGCFNNLHKINPQIIGLWARILEALPESRLMLKDRRFEDPDVTAWVQQAFQAEGIPAERLILEKASPHAELLRTYNRIDIALDPWPYTGGLTTIEALFMGVPVVTCPGPSFAGRHAASHLTNAGLPEWVAQDFDDYKRIALDWANHLDDLAELRRNLRSQFQKSPLSGHVQFAANLLHAFELMYQQWAEGKPAAPIEFNGPVPIPESVLANIPETIDPLKRNKSRESFNQEQNRVDNQDSTGDETISNAIDQILDGLSKG